MKTRRGGSQGSHQAEPSIHIQLHCLALPCPALPSLAYHSQQNQTTGKLVCPLTSSTINYQHSSLQRQHRTPHHAGERHKMPANSAQSPRAKSRELFKIKRETSQNHNKTRQNHNKTSPNKKIKRYHKEKQKRNLTVFSLPPPPHSPCVISPGSSRCTAHQPRQASVPWTSSRFQSPARLRRASPSTPGPWPPAPRTTELLSLIHI